MHPRPWKFLLLSIMAQHLATAAAKPAPKVIYGSDNRIDYYETGDVNLRNLADATVALIKSSGLKSNGSDTAIVSVGFGKSMGLCTSEPFYNQETAAFCSGFLVAPDTIVTAGHCVSASSCFDVHFVFDFKLEAANRLPHSVPTNRVFSCKQVVHSVSVATGEDFAVVKLDRPVTHVAPLALRGAGSPAVGDDLTVVGYPSGLPVKVADGAKVRAVQSQFLVANLDTYGGNSGSAVFNSGTGLVEGVLVRGEVDFVYNNGCNQSKVCASDGCRGEDVTLIHQVLPYLN